MTDKPTTAACIEECDHMLHSFRSVFRDKEREAVYSAILAQLLELQNLRKLCDMDDNSMIIVKKELLVAAQEMAKALDSSAQTHRLMNCPIAGGMCTKALTAWHEAGGTV